MKLSKKPIGADLETRVLSERQRIGDMLCNTLKHNIPRNDPAYTAFEGPPNTFTDIYLSIRMQDDFILRHDKYLRFTLLRKVMRLINRAIVGIIRTNTEISRSRRGGGRR